MDHNSRDEAFYISLGASCLCLLRARKQMFFFVAGMAGVLFSLLAVTDAMPQTVRLWFGICVLLVFQMALCIISQEN